jgi:superfamily II DNA or RNA helicase
MYKNNQDSELINDINNRLEFINLSKNTRTPDRNFEFSSTQLFCRNYINPWTPYTRIINKAGVGVGKTLTALLVAKSFIDEDRNVIVISYQQERFLEEIVLRPELKFVTKEEVNELDRLQRLSKSGTQESIKNYKDYRTKLRRRNKSITFYGYGEFTNRIFDIERLDNPKVNYDLIESLRNGLIICDEIHNAYNAIEQNNYGKAIQFVINILGPSVYLMMLSATPLTNSTEITDFLSLLADSPGLNIGKLKYIHSDNQKDIVNQIINFDYPKLEQYKLPPIPSDEQITNRVRGKVIFVPDTGVENMPKRISFGDFIRGIKYIKFIRVPMSEFQETLSKDNQFNYHLRDLGGISYGIEENNNFENEISPSYDKEEFNFNLLQPDNINQQNQFDEFRLLLQDENHANKIKIIPVKTSEGIYIKGEGLKYNNLMKFSPKYCKMLDLIFDAVPGKILVYHHYVHGTGVLTIQEIFKENGIIGEGDAVNEFTRCAKCGKLKKMHNNDHDFVPMRFISIHSKLDKSTADRNRIKFNSITNINGDEFRILLGSRKIKEGMDFKAVKTQIILGLPTNMSILLQVFGRTARTLSHDGLPRDEWFVNTYVLICQYRDTYNNYKPLDKSTSEDFDEINSSPEEKDYKKKVDDYLKIQHYDMIINKNAIDAYIMDTKQRIDENIDNVLKPITFELDPIKKLSESAKVTYFALERYKDEIITLKYLINKAFKIKNIWDVYQLWDYIRTLTATPNPKFFDIRNFMITLKSNPELNIIDNYVINSDKEIESFVRKHTHQNELKLMKFTGIKENMLLSAILTRVNKFSSNKKIGALDVYDIYEKFNINMHIKLLEDALIIENYELLEETDLNKKGSSKNIKNFIKHNSDKIIRFYSDLFDMKSSKDLGFQNLIENNKKIIGYVYNNNVKYITKKGWKIYNYVDITEENDIIIGIYSEDMQFKLRDPIKKSKLGESKMHIDMRKLQRGANCLTRNKIYLSKLIKRLNINTKEFTIFNLCEIVKRELIQRESEKKNNVKWVYFN